MTFGEIIDRALENPKIQKALEGKYIVKIIYVHKRVLNFVTEKRSEL